MRQLPSQRENLRGMRRRQGPQPRRRGETSRKGEPVGGEGIKVVVDMAADLFHAGHVAFLEKVRARFPMAHVTIWLNTDEQILSYKGSTPVMDYACRKAVLDACRLVDRVIESPDVYTSTALEEFDFICHGDDLFRWDAETKERFYGAAIRENKLVTFPYTEGISTTLVIRRCKEKA